MHAECGYQIREEKDPEFTLLCRVCAVDTEMYAQHAKEDTSHDDVLAAFNAVVEDGL